MDSFPSQLGRFNIESTTSSSTASSSSSSSSRKENNSLGRRNSTPLTTFSSSRSLFEHNLSSILNNPTRSADASWVGWWPSSSASVVLPEFAPINTSRPELETSRSDFQPYLSSISELFQRFEDIRNHTSRENVDAGVESIGWQGEALVACLREVPALYFKEDFQLEEGGTFKAACPFSTVSENLLLQERLSQYLDVVELHLVKEISLRSNSFFVAQRQLEDLSVKVVEGCKRIRVLKEMIRLLDADLVDSARQIQELNGSRSNFLAIQQRLRLILYVNQALSALKLLVTSADCAGALDVADDLQHLLDGDELTGLHCFRHLRDHVTSAIDSINSILSAEFMHTSLFNSGGVDAAILLRVKGASALSNGRVDEVKLDDEEAYNLRDCLLPVIIGLRRTGKLPSVLRTYNETLTADMKIAIKTAVAELLPVLLVRLLESDFSLGDRTVDADGGGSTLASRLRSLSSESFVQLLFTIFKIVLAHLVRAAEVKKSIEWIMSNLDGHYAAASVARAIEHGATATEAAQNSEAEVNHVLPHSLQRATGNIPSLQGNGNDGTSTTNVSKNFRADVLRENAEALFGACNAAHGRWAKLLGVRALLHPRLKLQEFISIYNITQEFITATEKIGGRLGYTIRGILQSQAKSFIEFQHESRMSKIKAVLDQETWVEVEVPDEFQAIMASIHDSDPVVIENLDDAQVSISMADGVLGSDNSVSDVGDGNGQKHVEQMDSNNNPTDSITHMKSHPLGEANKNNKADVATTTLPSNNSNVKDRGKSTFHMLMYRGASYHMVNCGLILIKMLSEYIDMNDNLPAHSMEIVRRVVDILKFFNTRTCQLVLGAGAMQVSGLKSITAKHLALASQVISFTYALIPDIRRILFLKVPNARKGLLSSDIDRVAQDYKIHRDEVHTKLVQIMRERLFVHLRGLSQIVEAWNRPEDDDTQPSQFARSLTKEVGFLQRVLSRTLHVADVQAIFRQVVIIFHTQITDAFSRLEISTPQAKNRLHRDLQHLLACIRSLPSDIASKSGVANWGPLDDFFAQRFGSDDGQ